MRWLLDTNVCVTYLRGKNPHVAQRVAAQAQNDISICSIVRAELSYGAHRSAQPRANLAKVHAFVGQFASLPFDDAAADVFGRLRAEVDSLGAMIGPYDVQIAAIALVHDLTLVTHNVGEFSRVPGLKIEDWEATT